jgi:hypothetical protein
MPERMPQDLKRSMRSKHSLWILHHLSLGQLILCTQMSVIQMADEPVKIIVYTKWLASPRCIMYVQRATSFHHCAKQLQHAACMHVHGLHHPGASLPICMQIIHHRMHACGTLQHASCCEIFRRTSTLICRGPDTVNIFGGGGALERFGSFPPLPAPPPRFSFPPLFPQGLSFPFPAAGMTVRQS